MPPLTTNKLKPDDVVSASLANSVLPLDSHVAGYWLNLNTGSWFEIVEHRYAVLDYPGKFGLPIS